MASQGAVGVVAWSLPWTWRVNLKEGLLTEVPGADRLWRQEGEWAFHQQAWFLLAARGLVRKDTDVSEELSRGTCKGSSTGCGSLGERPGQVGGWVVERLEVGGGGGHGAWVT